MELGEVFIITATVLLLFDFVILLSRTRTKREIETSFFVALLACVLIAAAYFRLTLAFLNDLFRLAEVYNYSSSGLAIAYKIGGPWIGSSGSMLFIAFLFSIAYFLYRMRIFGDESEFHIASCRILDIMFISLLIVTLLKSPFEVLPVTPPDGAGLNPLLQTFWVLVHPPIVFLGYVFVFFACAFMLAGMECGYRRLNLNILYAAWLFLAFGIALGGWWSYEVLGWGGYWAWDPVETASLLPWLALSAYFHLPGGMHRKDLMREFTLMITFFMVIFATALTRGGLLESVHAFGKSPVGPVLLIFAIGIVIYFFYLAFRTGKPIYALDVDITSLRSVATFTAFWSLMFLMIICFMGDLAPIIGSAVVGASMTTTPEFYNLWCYPFTLIFVAALAGCNINMKMKHYAVLILPVVITGVVLAMLHLPTPNWMANFGLPLLFTAGFTIVYYLVSAFRTGSSWYICGRSLLHLALIIILIGVFISSTAVSESGDIIAKPNSVVNAIGMKLNLDNYTIQPGKGHVYARRTQHFFTLPEYSSMDLNVSIVDGSRVYNGSLAMYYYTNYGIMSKPLIISTVRGDLYVFMQHTNSSYDALFYALMGKEQQPEDFIIRVKRVPLVWTVWLGVIMIAISMVILICDESRKK